MHVDPISSQSPIPHRSDSKRTATSLPGHSATRAITEVFASTRPYPTWWSELDDSRVLRRRKSFGDCILERNLCFVDTPGYSIDGRASETNDAIVNYVEAQLRRVTSASDLKDGDFMNFLTGNGGPQVDVVLFMFSRSGLFPLLCLLSAEMLSANAPEQT